MITCIDAKIFLVCCHVKHVKYSPERRRAPIGFFAFLAFPTTCLNIIVRKVATQVYL